MSKNEHTKTQELNALSVPLHGSKLIEASAGTGKTFTIASLYLRLLLGHGEGGAQFHQPLTVDQILVVTFTEAATAELRDRIRRRIREARVAFARGETNDPVIAPLLNSVSDHKSAAATLLQAERQMDEAAIFTIHGFCQRMLTQNAFESGCLFNTEFLVDEGEVRAQVVADFWRRHFYSLSTSLVGEVIKLWKTPNDLLWDINSFISGAPIKIKSRATCTEDIEALHTENLNTIHRLKKAWLAEADTFWTLISNSGVNKRSYTKTSLPKYINEVTDWAHTPTESYSYPKNLEKFSQAILDGKSPKGNPPLHSIFSQIEEFLDNPPDLKQSLMELAIRNCRTRLAETKVQKGWMSFDDLLTNLSAALMQDHTGVLATRIREQYPFAMIDEFQDTDPLQYHIFQTVYNDSVKPEDREHYGIFMIGDPKQAIYAFRGADIFTYIQARRHVSERFTLGTNWRSSYAMVESVNAIFQHPASPFIYDEDIEFLPIKANSKVNQRKWTLNNIEQPALSFWLQDSDTPVPKTDYLDVMASATAAKIQEVLTLSQDGKAKLTKGNEQHSIEAGNIAILVRTGTEAALARKALAKQGIPSVYMSNRDSVFASNEAKDILRVLNAVLSPKDERLVRSALSSSLFGLSAKELDHLNTDENIWDNVVSEFIEYNNIWSRSGVQPMLRRLLTNRNVASLSLAMTGGERQLTNILHLGELLQQASQDIDSLHGLVNWLEENIKSPNGNSESQQLRLESDKNLVQIVTIHKSKGLEYDLVFMPFVCSYRESDRALYHDKITQEAVFDLEKGDDSLALSERERLAEDLRLIYVGLTRAVYACFIGMTPIRDGLNKKEPTGVHKSAIGYLVQNGSPMTVNGLSEELNRLSISCDYLSIVEPPVLPENVWVDGVNEATKVKAASFTGELDGDWWITSYSALVSKSSKSHGAAYEESDIDPLLFEQEAQEKVVSLIMETEFVRSIYSFPRGAQAGTFLHTLFEEVHFGRDIDGEINTKIITNLMEYNNIDLEWLGVLQEMIGRVLNHPLDGENLKLADIRLSKRLTEMEFLLPIHQLEAPKLNAVLRKHDALSNGHGLDFEAITGLLKGFIDLVFEYEGKFYVLDWKSNHLGDTSECYQQANLEAAMSAHRYDLQYNLYSLALQRYLKSRIPDYDYETHFGGVYYLFLRGIEEEGNTGIFYARPSAELLDEMDELVNK